MRLHEYKTNRLYSTKVGALHVLISTHSFLEACQVWDQLEYMCVHCPLIYVVISFKVSLDGERNNKRVMPRRRNHSLNYTRQDTSQRANMEALARRSGAEGRITTHTASDRNNNNEDKDDGVCSSSIFF